MPALCPAPAPPRVPTPCAPLCLVQVAKEAKNAIHVMAEGNEGLTFTQLVKYALPPPWPPPAMASPCPSMAPALNGPTPHADSPLNARTSSAT